MAGRRLGPAEETAVCALLTYGDALPDLVDALRQMPFEVLRREHIARVLNRQAHRQNCSPNTAAPCGRLVAHTSALLPSATAIVLLMPATLMDTLLEVVVASPS